VRTIRLRTGGGGNLRRFILAGLMAAAWLAGPIDHQRSMAMDRQANANQPSIPSDLVTIFLTGDVMIGRGIDQVLPHAGDPAIHEPYMKSARGYVDLAEKASGPIPQPVDWAYIWGDALGELTRRAPDLRVINLETSITSSDEYWPNKGINYRMHPGNMTVLTAAGIDYCSLANNHVLDWGYPGLRETLEVLQKAGIRSAGAGRNLEEAERPAVLPIGRGRGRVIALSYGMRSSGIPMEWAASENRPGVNLLTALSDQAVLDIKEKIERVRRPGDIVLLSIHWGGNWGYAIPSAHRAFARRLIDQAGVDIIHGHSSHHVMGLEVYRNRPIFYGSGDFLNDYEGISGYEEFRGNLGLMYFVTMESSTGRLVRLHLVPTRIKQFRINNASGREARWLMDVLNRESSEFGIRIAVTLDNSLTVGWDLVDERRP
jgi:poly-gamma-glutamate capsule biosynthesis protein CapA/YwtB (metallophosphatase superfamily)